MTITITCEQCHKKEEYIFLHKNGNRRRFCTICANSRKYEKIGISNKMRIGRPILPVNKVYGKEDCKFMWDGASDDGMTVELGY